MYNYNGHLSILVICSLCTPVYRGYLCIVSICLYSGHTYIVVTYIEWSPVCSGHIISNIGHVIVVIFI